jgi:hypothetical protein
MSGDGGGIQGRAPWLLSWGVAVLVAAQAGLGLALPHEYRDQGWVALTWFGNDLVTLLLSVPLLVTGLLLARRGSHRGTLLWMGMLGYALYNGMFYMLGTTINVFFPLYVAILVMAVAALIVTLPRLPLESIRNSLPEGKGGTRWVAGWLVLVAAGLTAVWMGMWAAHVFGGQEAPGGVDVFRLVAALDLSIMVPALATGGVLLWRRSPWGVPLAAMASLQGGLYLVVLGFNGVVAIREGFVDPPGEVPIWGGLAAGTLAAAALLLRGVGSRPPHGDPPSGPSRGTDTGGVAFPG